MGLPQNPASLIAWAINWLILVVLIAIAVLVFIDARKLHMTPGTALVWSIVSLFTFPIGLLVYVFFGRKMRNNPTHQKHY
ncbi:MAG: hypothetical protein TUN42_07525 [Dehalogenimonas sp.]